MAALCHDLGHLPFSHVAERVLLGSQGHERMTVKIIESDYLKFVWDKLKNSPAYAENLTERDMVEDIKKIAIGERKWKELTGKEFTPWERIVSEIITGDFFGADRIDYLLRDAKSTGVAYGLFDYHQLIEMLRVLPSVEEGSEGLRLGIDENGLESCEALLLARHFMYRRIYQYSSVKAYNFHLRRYMKAVFSPKMLEDIDVFLSNSDTDVIASLNKAARDPKAPGHMDAKCVIFRQHRFRALALPDSMTEKDLQSYKTKEKLKDFEMDWEFPTQQACQIGLNFPVSKRHIVLQTASSCSDLLKQIPTKKMNWVYISPEKDFDLMAYIGQWAP